MSKQKRKFEGVQIVKYNGLAPKVAGVKISTGQHGYIINNLFNYRDEASSRYFVMPLVGVCDISNCFDIVEKHAIVGTKFITNPDMVKGNFYAPNKETTVHGVVNGYVVVSWGSEADFEMEFSELDYDIFREKLGRGIYKIIKDE